MRNHSFNIFHAVVLMVLFITACKKEALDKYSTTDSIYFENFNNSGFQDSSNITFAYSGDLTTDSTISIKVNVTGKPANRNRTFSIVRDSASTAIEGTHFEELPEEFSLAASQVSTTVQIKLLRTPDMKDATIDLVLRINPTSDFTTNFVIQGINDQGDSMSYLTYKIAMSDILVEPAGWMYLFGKFSKKKMEIISTLGKVPPSWFVLGDEKGDIYSTYFDNKRSYMVDLLVNYLAKMANDGSPVYYEDGTLMRTDDYF